MQVLVLLVGLSQVWYYMLYLVKVGRFYLWDFVKLGSACGTCCQVWFFLCFMVKVGSACGT